jgi:hypothetical protein
MHGTHNVKSTRLFRQIAQASVTDSSDQQQMFVPTDFLLIFFRAFEAKNTKNSNNPIKILTFYTLNYILNLYTFIAVLSYFSCV